MIEYLKAADQIKALGLDNSEFIARAKFTEGVRVAVERGDVGFRGGWVSCGHIDSDLHPKKWAGLLGAMGYDLHPSMAATGRSSHPVSVGTGRAWLRLFVKRGHEGESIEQQAAAVYAFKKAQSAP